MPTRVLHVRLGDDCAHAVTALAEAYALSISEVLRLAVRDLLAHEERFHMLLWAGNPPASEDLRTSEQASNWLRDREKLIHMDLTALLAYNDPE